MRFFRRLVAVGGGLLVMVAVSAGVTIGIAEYYPEVLPEGPRGAQGPPGETGPAGPQGAKGEPGEPEAIFEDSDESEADAPADEPEHFYYGDEDLGTVAQHEAFCRSLRRRQEGEGINDQDELEREGCRGGGFIARPSDR